MLKVNECPLPYTPGVRLSDITRELKPDADLFIVNGAPVAADYPLADGDSCWLLKRGEIPDMRETERLLYARHTPGVHELIRAATIGIMGLGGLGSAVAVALARIGVGRLLLVDYDVVEPYDGGRRVRRRARPGLDGAPGGHCRSPSGQSGDSHPALRERSMTWRHSPDPVRSPASVDALHLQAHRVLSHFENGGQLLANEDHEDLL